MTIIAVHHDKETYSECDLKAFGAYKYARDPSTDCLLTSGIVPAESRSRIRRWRPGDPYPYRDIHNDDIEIHAWNSQFERRIWWDVMVPKYGWPRLALEQFVCVAAQARITAAGPQKLDTAGNFFDRPQKKDHKGHRHMLVMCRPADPKLQAEWCDARGNDIAPGEEEWMKRCHHTDKALDRLHDYCDPDVLTELGIHSILPAWNAEDLEDFHESERINDHGIVVDTDFATAAMRYAEDEKRYFAAEIRRISDGHVETPRQFDLIKKWLLPLLSEEARAVARWYDNGKEKYSFDADTRGNLLNQAGSDLEWVAHHPADADDIVEFIELLDAAGKSAIAKYEALLNRAVVGITDDLPRVHGLYVFAGASQSGRFSSTGLQAHNFIRDVPKNAVALISAFKRDKGVMPLVEAWAADTNKGKGAHSRKARAEPVHALGALMRPVILSDPDGAFDLCYGDWSSIEACANPWLSLDKDAEDRLAILRRGEDIYLKTASALCKRTITKDDKEERNAFGKVPELSLGYLGGNGAFKAMMRNYGVFLPDSEISKAVKDWRADNPWAMRFGANCEQAAMAALRRTDGASFGAGRLSYHYDPDAFDGIGALFCTLPSGRPIPYPGARIQQVLTSWGERKLGITAMKSAWKPKAGEAWENWPRVSLWPGLLIENATQGICADLLRLGLHRARAAGLTVCMHTHDEIMIETANADRDAKTLWQLMVKPPRWPGADSLPLRAEVEVGYRYKVPTHELKDGILKEVA